MKVEFLPSEGKYSSYGSGYPYSMYTVLVFFLSMHMLLLSLSTQTRVHAWIFCTSMQMDKYFRRDKRCIDEHYLKCQKKKIQVILSLLALRKEGRKQMAKISKSIRFDKQCKTHKNGAIVFKNFCLWQKHRNVYVI